MPRVPVPRIPRRKVTHTHASIVVNWALVSLAVVLLWSVLFALGLSSFEHSHYQSVMYAKFRQELAADTAPLGARSCLPVDNSDGTQSVKCRVTQVGDPIAVMDAPAAGLRNEVVVEGTASGQLAKAVGHLRTSVFPGQPSTSYLYGRSKLFGGPFHAITSMRPGDTISFTTGEGTSKYAVTDVRRKGDPLPNFADGHSHLVLVTSEAGGWRSGWAAQHTVYVDAVLEGTPWPDTGGRPASVDRAELAMQGDPSALYQLVLWLPLLALTGGGIVWAHHHWGGWQTWVVGVPLLACALWGATETAAQFLPNMM